MNSLSTMSMEIRGTAIPHLDGVARFPGIIGTFMGRDALSLAIRHLGLAHGDTVLLPVYTCQEVLRQFDRSTDVVFYDVRPDLTIDPDEVLAKLNGNRVSVMMITNYFGFLQPYRNEIKKICTSRGICLIEDCAHSLLTQGSGETGDLSIHSFRKILPLPDGGGLQVNGDGKLPVPMFYPRVYSNAISVLIMAKAILNIRSSKFSRARLTSHAEMVIPKITRPKTNDRILPLSRFADSRMANLSFPEIIQRRRSDFQFWQDVCRKSDLLMPVFDNLEHDVCPLGFPVKIENRELFESQARATGIDLSVHWRLDPKVGTTCQNSHALSRQMLTLPVYPELGQNTRNVLARMILSR